MTDKLRLTDLRAVFRLIGDLRALGSDPAQWRTHLVRRLRKLLEAELVISSEVHVRRIPGRPAGGAVKVIDVGWGCDGTGDVWQTQVQTEAPPEQFMLALMPGATDGAANGEAADGQDVPVRPTTRLRGGSSFVMSQYPLPHLGAVDQLSVYKDGSRSPCTPAQQKLIRLFHTELGRVWTKDALAKAGDAGSELPPRLAQTLAALQAGCSEKEVSVRLGISKHTVHNYVKALHHRLGVSSRGELLAKVGQPQGGFLPQFSVRD